MASDRLGERTVSSHGGVTMITELQTANVSIRFDCFKVTAGQSDNHYSGQPRFYLRLYRLNLYLVVRGGIWWIWVLGSTSHRDTDFLDTHPRTAASNNMSSPRIPLQCQLSTAVCNPDFRQRGGSDA